MNPAIPPTLLPLPGPLPLPLPLPGPRREHLPA